MLTRHEFLRSLLMTSLGAGVLVACKSDGSSTGDDEPQPDAGPHTCSSAIVLIGANHGHTMTVPPDDLPSTAAKTYDIQGSALHGHSVTLSADDFEKLRTSNQVIVTSTSSEAHSHRITVTC